jgi:hypothetical protein
MFDLESYFDFDKNLQIQEYQNKKPVGSSRPPTKFEIQLQYEITLLERELEKADKEIQNLKNDIAREDL